jgi:hypothetical protein
MSTSQVLLTYYIYGYKKFIMPTEVVINTLSGQSPFSVFLCDNPVSTCVFIDTITTVPFNFGIPEIFDGQTSFNLKITTAGGCEIFQNLTI